MQWGLKQSCSPHQKNSNDMSQATWTWGNQINYRLLVVENQIANLTPDLSFGHNLCFRCRNGSCEPIIDMYDSISLEWYKELFEPMGFDPWNHFLKIPKSMGTPTPIFPKWEFTWECEGSFYHTLLHSWERKMWLSDFPLGPQPCKPLPWSQAQG
jgi:hypothetical protein